MGEECDGLKLLNNVCILCGFPCVVWHPPFLHFLFIVVRLLLWTLWTGSVVSCCTGLVYKSVRVSESLFL